jgi:hypothetical protein
MKNNILEEIEKEHIRQYGPLCTKCNMYQKFCRCEELKAFTYEMSKSGFNNLVYLNE